MCKTVISDSANVLRSAVLSLMLADDLEGWVVGYEGGPAGKGCVYTYR